MFINQPIKYYNVNTISEELSEVNPIVSAHLGNFAPCKGLAQTLISPGQTVRGIPASLAV